MTTPLSQASDGEMSQSEQVRQLVGEEILTGRLEPGALLSESGLPTVSASHARRSGKQFAFLRASGWFSCDPDVALLFAARLLLK